jgi:hypothetical protein
MPSCIQWSLVQDQDPEGLHLLHAHQLHSVVIVLLGQMVVNARGWLELMFCVPLPLTQC